MAKGLALVAACAVGLVIRVGPGIGTGFVTALSAQVTTTSHPPVPSDSSHYWLTPDPRLPVGCESRGVRARGCTDR